MASFVMARSAMKKMVAARSAICLGFEEKRSRFPTRGWARTTSPERADKRGCPDCRRPTSTLDAVIMKRHRPAIIFGIGMCILGIILTVASFKTIETDQITPFRNGHTSTRGRYMGAAIFCGIIGFTTIWAGLNGIIPAKPSNKKSIQQGSEGTSPR